MKSKPKGSTRRKKIQPGQTPDPAPLRRQLGAEFGIHFIELENMRRTLDGLYSPEGPDVDVCINEGRHAFQVAKSLLDAVEYVEIQEREAGSRTDGLERYRMQAIEFYLEILAASHWGLAGECSRLKHGRAD